MKKLIAMLLMLCLGIGLCACASMDNFEDNLEGKYAITLLDDDDLEDYADLLDLDVDDYNIKSAIEATHKKKYTSVVIIECGSSAKASKLAEDAEDIVDILEAYYRGYTFDCTKKGRFVLFGEVDAIDDALDN